jgi:hypothetical protein
MEEASALANKVGIMAKQMLGMPYIVDIDVSMKLIP